MDKGIGMDLQREFPRRFVPADADLGSKSAVEGLYRELEKRELATREQLEDWLRDWSELSAALSEEEAVRYIRMTCRTDDPDREKAFLHFVENISPHIKNKSFALSKMLLDSGGRAELPEERYSVLMRDMKNHVEIFREENIPLQTEEEKLSQQYQKLVGSMTVSHEGEEKTLQEMSRYLEYQERDIRQEAWEKVTDRRLQEREELDRIFDQMLELRGKIAANAGFDNYRDYAFPLRGRFDYGVEDCEKFHAAVEKEVVPLYRDLQEKRKKEMGLDKLRPWDLRANPQGRPPLKPFEEVKDLVAGCGKIFERLDPALGAWFKFMADHDLLDLESRKGKAPGAYSHGLEEMRLPFIFANAVGVDHDVYTLLHEAGHSFHTVEARHEPLVFYRHAPIEFGEVASMSMEFLGADHLEVFYSEADKSRSRREHLESVAFLFAWIATVDAFQHWIYTHPGHSREERAQAWVDLRERFGGIEDWSGLEDARSFEWHRQLHIFQIPFYYIEYGIAQLGALQVWERSGKNKEDALRDYRHALSLGGSKKLPELFRAAGINFDMSEKTLGPLMDKVKAELRKSGG
ncbi:MAG: M3 family oligoendopeptidase [bacterium]